MNADELVDAVQDPLNSYFFSCRLRTTESFDRRNEESLNDAIGSISKIFSLQMILFAKGADLLGVRFDAFALFRAALDTLISAVHLARQRAFIEATCLLRSAVESACTGLHICRSPEAYESFVNDSYESTRSISAVKKEISIVGQLWGTLSRTAVHVNRRTHGPRFKRNGRDGLWTPSIEFQFGVRTADSDQDRMILVLIALVAEVVDRAQELALLDEDPNRPGWRKIPGISTISCSGTEKAISDRFAHFLQLAERGRHSSESSQEAP